MSDPTPEECARRLSARLNDCVAAVIDSRDMAHGFGMLSEEMACHALLGRLQLLIDSLCVTAGIDGPLWPDDKPTTETQWDEEADTQPVPLLEDE